MNLKIKETLAKILSVLPGLVATQSFSSGTTNIGANGAATIQIDCAKAGYTPIGIKHLQNNVGGSVIINGYWWSGTTLFVNNRNITNLAASNVRVVCTITYAKTAIAGGGNTCLNIQILALRKEVAV